MDDECVEDLGRPISSLKVSELRDELAKRALIKTGKKNELIDRLRQAISKQSTSTPSSASVTPADLIVQQAVANQIESAIDYSTPQTQQIIMTSSQQQDPSTAADVVDYSATKVDSEQNVEKELLAQQDELDGAKREPQINEDEIKNQENLVQLEQSNTSKQESERFEIQQEEEELVESENKEEISHDQQQKSQELELKQDSSCKLTSSSESNLAETCQEANGSDEIDQASAQDATTVEHNSVAPVVFTLKRGNRDNSSYNKEKRRKWSGKSESSQNSDSILVSGGISSQKLQELIDVKQLQSSEPEIREALQKTIEPEISSESKKVLDSQSSEAADVSNDAKNGNDITEDDVDDKNKKEVVDKHRPNNTEEREATNWLIIKNLTRPYTVEQLKEELTKFGHIIKDKFWTDTVKSKCCVLYESVEAAQQTKERLQGQHWPVSNPKSLVVEFITEEIYKGHIAADSKQSSSTRNSDNSRNNIANGAVDKTKKRSNDRLGDRLDAGEEGSGSIRSRLGEKLGGDDVVANSSNADRTKFIDSQPKELDDFFRKTQAKPQLFWLPLNEEQAMARSAEREQRDKRAQELSQNATKSRRSPPQTNRRRSPARRSPPRHRSPARRSPIKRRSPIRRRTPPPLPQPPSRRSPARKRPPLSPRGVSPPRRRSPPRGPSPLLRRRVSPRNSPPMRMRTPHRDSPFRRRTQPYKDSPPPRRRSPSPLLRRRSPPRDSPPIRRRSPEPRRRSPGGYNRRSPDIIRRSPPGSIRRLSPGRRSPVMLRSPGMMRRSPGPIRRSPGLMRRSPGPFRRSPIPIRRSPGPVRRSPVSMKRPRGARDYD